LLSSKRNEKTTQIGVPARYYIIEEVYQIILPKMINSRFSVVLRKWKEAHCQKHEMSLRSSLKAGVKSLPLKRAATQHTDESMNEIKKAKSSE